MRAITTCVAAPDSPSVASVAPAGLPRTAVVGVLGGGQLGKMLGQEAVRRRAAAAAGGA